MIKVSSKRIFQNGKTSLIGSRRKSFGKLVDGMLIQTIARRLYWISVSTTIEVFMLLDNSRRMRLKRKEKSRSTYMM